MIIKEIIDQAFSIAGFLWLFAAICFLIVAIHSIIKHIYRDVVFDLPILKHPIRSIKNLIYGPLYVVKVNGVWSVRRGKKVKKPSPEGYLKIRYGRDKHEWMLDYSSWKEINNGSSKSEINQIVVDWNISELKKSHPAKKKKKTLIEISDEVDSSFEQRMRFVENFYYHND